MSGRDELLDEAIAKAKEAEDWQLVEWLRMARGSESAARWYTERLRDTNRTIRKLLDENAKLRELVREVWRSCPTSEDDCARCPHRIEESDEVWCDIPILMVELGVEVDG